MPDVRLRLATPADTPALVRLERLAPEAGPVAVRVDFHGDYLALGSRLGRPAVYVAEGPGSEVVGTLSAVTRRARLNDGWGPATYLFRLRVLPAWRRQGVAARLVEHAEAEARREHGSQAAWGAILARNHASRALARAMGFRSLRTLAFRVLPTRWPAPGRAHLARPRPARPEDGPAITAQARALYEGCQFWPGPSPPGPDTWVWADRRGVRASAAVFDLAALATVRVIAQYPLLGALTTLLARLGGLPDLTAPLRVGFVHDLTFAPERPADGAALVGTLLRALRSRLDFAIVVGDPAHPTGGVLRRLPWGLPGRVVLVTRGLVPIDPGRPAYMALG